MSDPNDTHSKHLSAGKQSTAPADGDHSSSAPTTSKEDGDSSIKLTSQVVDDKRLARRSVTSTAWNIIANFIKLPISLVQAVILARLLPIEYFGVVAGVLAVVNISVVIFDFGLTGAFIHRAPETQDEDHATAVLFSLRIIFFSIWAFMLIAGAFLFFPPAAELRRLVFVVLVIGTYLQRIAITGRALLVRRVQHRRLALLDMTQAVILFLTSSLIAVTTGSIWALLVGYLLVPVWIIIVMYIWRAVWRPRWALDGATVRYYLNFGRRLVPGEILKEALDKFDDLWTNIFLGDRLLGFYSKAYSFAVYPRIILAGPVKTVTAGTYAELKYDRVRLSQAFNRVNSLLIRSGFLLAGLLAVVAPHFIRIFLGERWLPMLDAFRLMLVYTLLDPIKLAIADILVAVGKPEKVSQARFIQFVIMVVGLFTLGLRFEIAGVALAVDLMLVVGIIMLFYFVRPYVDFSARQLFMVPGLALVCGIFINWLTGTLWNLTTNDWLALMVKSVVFSLGYLTVLFAFEGRLLIRDFKYMARTVISRPRVNKDM